MIKRGQASFAILFIINPIVILFYQNCSVLPVHSKSLSAQSIVEKNSDRRVASSDTLYSCRTTVKLPCAE